MLKFWFKFLRKRNEQSFFHSFSSMFILFLLRPPTKWRYCDVTMHALYYLSRNRGKTHRHSVLPVTEQEGKENGKWSISSMMKMYQQTEMKRLNTKLWPFVWAQNKHRFARPLDWCSLDWCSISPFPSLLFQSQVGHSSVSFSSLPWQKN